MKKKILVGIMAGVMALQSGMFAAAEEPETVCEAEEASVLEEVSGSLEEDAGDIIISENDAAAENAGGSEAVWAPETSGGDAAIQTEEETPDDPKGDGSASGDMIETIELLNDPDFEPAETAEDGIAVDEANFPDEIFRNYVKSLDKDGDNRLSEKEIKKVTEIDLKRSEVRSLKGIEYFPYLESLVCSENYLAELDLSKNTALTRLECESNNLSFLNLEKNKKLEYIFCSDNAFSVQTYEDGGMWKFDLGKITGKDNLANIFDIQVQDDYDQKLADAYLSEDGIVSVAADKLSSVRITVGYSYHTKAPKEADNPVMKMCVYLMPPSPEESDLSGMQEAEINETNFPDKNFRTILRNQYDANGDGKLDVKELSAITRLSVRNVDDLTGIKFFGALMILDCTSDAVFDDEDDEDDYMENEDNVEEHYLTELDVSGNPMLRELHCPRNKITELNVSGNTELTVLDCSRNEMEKLDLSKNKKLKTLKCSGCYNLEKLDVSGNTALETLWCFEGRLKELNVSGAAALKDLSCYENDLTELDVSGNTALEDLDCSENKLGYLDLEKNSRLTHFNSDDNRLSTAVYRKDGAWQFDLSAAAGIQNMDRVTLDSDRVILSDTGIVTFQGVEMPESLFYHYNTKAAVKPAMRITITLDRDSSSDCDVHEFGEYEVIKEATALEEGTQICICEVCGYEQRESIAKLTPTIELNAQKIILQVKQSTSKLKVSGLAKGDSVKSWKSSSQKIVKVTSKGKITAQKTAGTAQVTISLASGLQKKIPVTVQKSSVKTTKISGLTKTLTLKKGRSETLKPVISPITSQEKVTYKSSNKKIVTVSAKGVVSAKGAGTASVTVTSGKQKFTVKVTVEK